MGILLDLLEFHKLDEFAIVELTEADTSGWSIGKTKAYKRGLKKHGRDSRVLQELEKLINFVKSRSEIPPIQSYPPELNVHQLKNDPRFPGKPLWAHLKGQKIGVIFSIGPGKQLNLLALGTHQDMGWA